MDIDGVVERKNEMEFQPLPHPQRSTLWVLRQTIKTKKPYEPKNKNSRNKTSESMKSYTDAHTKHPPIKTNFH